TPPDWLFPVAWTLLYIAMAVAAARVGTRAESAVALALWSLQIALNTLWTPVFFGLHRLRAALVVLSALWVAVVATTVVFLRTDWVAGLLFVPYVVWLSYAGALNFAVWRMNSGDGQAAQR